MRALVQRTGSAAVRVDQQVVGAIDQGLLILMGVGPADGEAQAVWLARKLSRLRVFQDPRGRMNLSLLDVGGQALVVSQFTLYADCRRGNRPSFTGSAPPELAEPLYERFCELLAETGVPVARGSFGALMQVELVNDGPVTLLVEAP